LNQKRPARHIAGRAPHKDRGAKAEGGASGGQSESSESEPQPSRRGILAGAVGFILGAASGAIGTYMSEYAKVAVPPGEIADQNSSEPAVRGTILLEHDESMQGLFWALPFVVSERPEVEQLLLNGIPRSRDIDYPMRALGAADINVTRCRLIIEGRRNGGVQVLQIRANGVAREPLGSGSTLTGSGPEGTGALVRIAFNLDEADPVARHAAEDSYVYADDYFAEPYFSDTTLSLARNEQQVFDIVARTLRHYIEWRIDVQVLSAGVASWVTIGASDEPLRTNALRNPRGSDDSTQAELADYAETYKINFEAPDSQQVVRFIRSQ
jgi:hypothetical protein